MAITDKQLERYARHIVMDEVGEEGQEKLLASKVLVIGAGGLGSPVLMYLAAAGVGTLGVVDFDVVDTSNLQRQIVHSTENIGDPKVASAAERLYDLNPEIAVQTHRQRFTPDNALSLISQYDLVADGSDNFGTRFALADACYRAGKTLVYAAILRFDGQLTTFKPYLGPPHPCLRCLHPEPPDDDAIPRCEQAGILGALAGTLGAMQGVEVLKELLGIGESLSGSLLLYDALGASFRRIRFRRSEACPLCSRWRPQSGKAA